MMKLVPIAIADIIVDTRSLLDRYSSTSIADNPTVIDVYIT